MPAEGVCYQVFDQNIDGAEKIKEWIRGGLDKFAVEYANQFGQDLAQHNLTTSQIRNVFGEVRRIQMKWEETAVLLLKPKLAYAAKRAEKKTKIVQKFKCVLTEGVQEIVSGYNEEDKKERFQRFVDFFEAVLAYHKSYGGKD